MAENMKNDMRDEFEDYVRKLTKSICEDIFLEELKNLYEKYSEIYGRYSESVSIADESSKKLEQEANNAKKFLDSIDHKTQGAIEQLEEHTEQMQEYSKHLFSEMETLKKSEKEEFISDLSNIIDAYKGEISRIFKEGDKKISEKLAGVITVEDLEKFRLSMEANTKETKELAAFVGDEYKSEVEKSIKSIVDNNRKAMEETNSTVSTYVEKLIKEFDVAKKSAEDTLDAKSKNYVETTSKYATAIATYFNKFLQSEKAERAAAIEEQKKLISQIGPSDEKMQQLEKRVANIEKAVSEIKNENATQIQKIGQVLNAFYSKQEEYERQKQEAILQIRKENEDLKIRVSGVTGFLSLIVCVLLMLELFTSFGLVGLVACGLVITAIVVLKPSIRMNIMYHINNLRNRNK